VERTKAQFGRREVGRGRRYDVWRDGGGVLFASEHARNHAEDASCANLCDDGLR